MTKQSMLPGIGLKDPTKCDHRNKMFLQGGPLPDHNSETDKVSVDVHVCPTCGTVSNYIEVQQIGCVPLHISYGFQLTGGLLDAAANHEQWRKEQQG